ncbi:MAG: ribokinase [Robiginitomaculum sp.]|nr:MAG: ribokinase [Robiginitomaculum sp.]
MKRAKVTIVGSINCDLSFAVADFPKPHETILANSSSLSLGGKGLNQAIAAACAGADTAMIGSVGNDTFGDKAKAYARGHGVNLAGLKTVSDTPTGTAGILVTRAGENMIIVSPGANACLLADDVLANRALIETTDIVLAQLECPAKAVRTALDLARAGNVYSILNPAPATPEAQGLIACADLITPNECESEAITGIFPQDAPSAEQAAQALCALGAKDVLITMGAMGYYLFSNGQGCLHSAFDITAIDPTGAGDVFNGVLARLLGAGRTLEEAARYASAAGAMSVRHTGAERAAPELADIEAFLAQNA